MAANWLMALVDFLHYLHCKILFLTILAFVTLLVITLTLPM